MRVGALLGIVVGLAACTEAPSPVAPFRTLEQPPALSAVNAPVRQTLPFSTNLWVSCANNGLGEFVNLNGQLEFQSQTVDDGNGGTHLSAHVRPSGVVGTGVVSGLRYRGTGVTVQMEGHPSAGEVMTYTFVNNFRIIGQGPKNNILVHYTMHLTVNANGDQTASVNLSSSECR